MVMAITQQEPVPKSGAWTFGWLSLSGPVLLLAVNVPSQFIGPLIPWVSILLDLWCVVSVVFGIVAIRLARNGTTSLPQERPRLASAGMMLAAAALAVDGCVLLLWLLTPMSF
jgi:hypothetical protein